MNKTEIKKKWIFISLLSLALSGAYSIFIVMLRAPILTNLFPDKSIFQTCLIIHVDLSVLFWMVCFAMIHISDYLEAKYDYLVKFLQNLLIISVCMIFLSPFFGESEPYMNNYIPILHNLLFIIALAFFISVYFIVNILGVFSSKYESVSLSILGLAILLSFFISAIKLSRLSYPLDQYNFYETLFWGGGHLLQFLYCSGLIVAFAKFFENNKQVIGSQFFLIFNTLCALPLPIIQAFLPVDSDSYFSLYTEHMKIFGAISPICFIFAIMISNILPSKDVFCSHVSSAKSIESLKSYSFIFSSLLFGSGGVLALLIDSSNVKIPAHYHGSIVGISIAFMGYIYLMVDKIYGKINYKQSIIQLALYSFGQLVHILSLSYAGGYGALRKTPGVDLPANVKIAMGFMGAGGLIAIISGLLFLHICYKRIYNNIYLE